MKSTQYFFLVIFLLVLSSCSVSYKTIPYVTVESLSIDYNTKSNWAVFGGIDAKGKQIGQQKDSLIADIFFVYPTLLTNKKDTRWNAPINDSIINSDVLRNYPF